MPVHRAFVPQSRRQTAPSQTSPAPQHVVPQSSARAQQTVFVPQTSPVAQHPAPQGRAVPHEMPESIAAASTPPSASGPASVGAVQCESMQTRPPVQSLVERQVRAEGVPLHSHPALATSIAAARRKPGRKALRRMAHGRTNARRPSSVVDPTTVRPDDARVGSTSEPQADEPLPYPTWRAWAVTLVATATMTISYLDRQVLAALAPTITEQLDVGETEYGWLQSAFSGAYLLCAPFAGRMLERVGIRRGLVFAVLAWTVVSGAHALASSLAFFFVLRLLLGAAESPSFPGAAATIARTQPARHRARAIGVLFTGSSIGAMLAPIMATRLHVAFGGAATGVQGAFVGVALVGLLWVPLWWVVTSPPAVAARLGPSTRSPSVPEAARPRMRTVLAHPAVWQACIAVACASPLFAFVLLWGSKLLHDQFGVAQEDVGPYLVAPPLFYDLGAVVFGHLASTHARKHGERSVPVVLVLVATVLSSSFAAVALCTTPWQVVGVCSVAMAGGAGVFAMVTSDMIGRVGAGTAATAGGVTASAQSVLYVVANPTIGLGVEAQHGSYDGVIVGITALMVPGILVWLWLRRRTGESPLTPPVRA